MAFVPLMHGTLTLFPKCQVARDFWSRFMGIMLKKDLGREEALVFPKCNSIHTCFMRFPIDIIFVDEKGTIREIIDSLKPWRLLFPRRNVKHTIEVRAGLSREHNLTTGMQLKCLGVWQ